MSNFKGLEARFQPSRVSNDLLTYQWSLIRWIPDRVTGEQLAVGVILESNGFAHLRLIEDFSRLECAYNSDIVEYTKNTISMIDDLFNSKITFSISDQIIFEKKGIARGSDTKSTLDSLFEKAVPLGKPHNSDTRPYSHRFSTIRTSNFISDIQKYIKTKNVSIYEKMFPVDPCIKVIYEDNYHTLHIPIRVDQKAGSMVSTVYSTQDKLENHCLKAMNHLEVALRTENFQESALAILIASQADLSYLENYEIKRREDFLDDFVWKLKLKNIKSFTHTNSELASEALLKWVGDIKPAAPNMPQSSLKLVSPIS